MFEQRRVPPHTSSRSARRGIALFDTIAIVAAVVVQFAQPSGPWIEKHYSTGIYPAIDRFVRALTNPLPFCLGDVLFAIAVVWLARFWIVSILRAPGARIRAVGLALVRTFAVACGIYVWFEISWGYNYARIPLAEKVIVHDDRTDEDSVATFADRVTDRLSQLADAAHRERIDGDAFAYRLVPTFEATIRRLGSHDAVAPPRVKPTLFQPMMQLSASNGFTDPWTHEVNLDATASPYERPAIYAHEWAHIAGFADESEANFISVIACTTSRDPLLAYSGWILVWFNLPGDVHVSHRMGRTAYDDIMAIRAHYLKNVNTQVERVQRVAYDRYLKSNHVKAGYASYRLFIRWMTGADFDAAGLPRVRGETSF